MASRIVEVKAYEVIVPARPGSINSASIGHWGSDWDHMPICLLELRIDDGLTALGEVSRGLTLKEIEPWLKQLPGLALNGTSLSFLPSNWRAGFKWDLLESQPPALWQSPSPVAPAIEMALLDWAGKRLGCRAVDLLGGAVRERVPVDYWCARQTPQDLARIVTEARSRGFTGLKMKSMIGDPVVEQVRAIKDAAGHDFRVTIDPMFQWLSPHDALPMMKQLEPFAEGVRIEDPFPQDRPEFWQRARQVTAIPLILHTRSMDVLRRGLQDGFVDGYNCSGSIGEFMTQAHAVEVAGFCCWHGSAIEMGVAQVAHLHAAAAARACAWHSDFVSPLIREHTLITWDWPFVGDQLPLPAGPGLGIELDHDAIRRYQQAEATYK
jgi:muconate cycloisomerase